MRVVHSHPVWLPITQNWLYTLVAGLPGRVESHIACDRTAHLEDFRLPRIHSLSDRGPWATSAEVLLRKARRAPIPLPAGHAARTARRIDADLVHSHFGHVAWDDRPGVARTGAPHVVSVYGSDVSRLPTLRPHWRRRYADLFGAVDLVLCEGSRMAARVRDLGAPSDRVRVHHLGIRLEKLPFRPRRWRPGTPLRVLMAASFREKKGLPYGIDALGTIATDVDLEITLIGDATRDKRSQAEKAAILSAIERHHLSSSVRALGYQSYDRLLQEAYGHHVLVAPSVTAGDGDTEGGAPVTLIEMVASGMPVVSTAHADIPEVLGPMVPGGLAPERDPDGLVRQFRWLLDRSGDWEAWLRAGRRHVEHEYDAAQQGERLADIYDELTQPSRIQPR